VRIIQTEYQTPHYRGYIAVISRGKQDKPLHHSKMFEDIYIIHLKEKGVTCKFLFLGGVNVFWNYPSLLGSTFFVLRISTKHLFVMQKVVYAQNRDLLQHKKLAHGHYNSSCCQKCHIQIGCAHLLHPTYT
jgi:hypothetical protein